MDEVADMLEKHPVDALCDLLLDEDLRISYCNDVVDYSTIPDLVSHPLYMVGSDALLIGDYPAPNSYGSFPFILSDLVREERKIPLQDAVRKMTSKPAQRLGLSDLGLLQNGMKADVVVFDPKTIKPQSTPQNPRQIPTGIDYVIVNGVTVIENGHHTGALPGRALRRGAH